MRDNTGILDLYENPIFEGDILQDHLPSKGIVVKLDDATYLVTSDFNGRDINQIAHSDLLNDDLIKDNEMYVIGSIYNKD